MKSKTPFEKLENQLKRITLKKPTLFYSRNTYSDFDGHSWGGIMSGYTSEKNILLEGKYKKDFLRIAFLENILKNDVVKKSFPTLNKCMEEFEYMFFPYVLRSDIYLIPVQKEITKKIDDKIVVENKLHISISPSEFFKSKDNSLKQIDSLYQKISFLHKKYYPLNDVFTELKFTKDEIVEIFNEGMKADIGFGNNKGRYFKVDLNYKNAFDKLNQKINSKKENIFKKAEPSIIKYAESIAKLKQDWSGYLKNQVNKEGKKLLKEHNYTIELNLFNFII